MNKCQWDELHYSLCKEVNEVDHDREEGLYGEARADREKRVRVRDHAERVRKERRDAKRV